MGFRRWNMLEINGVSKKYGDFYAVDHVHLQLEKGVYGLLGANGAGKTTLMRMICTLINPSEGEICYKGAPILKAGEDYRNVLGYLPQDFGFYPQFCAEEYLLYIAALKGMKGNYARAKAGELLQLVSLEKAGKKKIKNFSGGMKRRLGIAQAVLNDPEILVLDEPTAGLDPKERIRFRNLISEMAEERIVLLSTHIVSDVENIANEILIMKDGRIQASGTVEHLTKMMEGMVWKCLMTHEEAAYAEERYTVCNRKKEEGGIVLTLLSKDKPAVDAREVAPSLEDVYMYYFGKEETGE